MHDVSSYIFLKNIPIKNDAIEHLTIKQSVINILFSSQQALLFKMSEGRSASLDAYSSYLIYEQNRDFYFEVSATKNTQLICLEIPIKALHSLISKGIDELNFSNAAVFEKERYHKFSANSEKTNECLVEITELGNPLMLEAKKFELLSYYFSDKDIQNYKCPFLNQKENVVKVRNAKDLLISDLMHSPTIKELSKQVGLNEHNLKSGFKEIYSKPIYAFLKDHKMNTAKTMIDSRQYKVNEIAEKMGYINVSHFIEAFKVKFGTTPKQYELKKLEE